MTTLIRCTGCARHQQHDPSEDHTDGEGAYWGDDGEVEYR